MLEYFTNKHRNLLAEVELIYVEEAQVLRKSSMPSCYRGRGRLFLRRVLFKSNWLETSLNNCNIDLIFAKI